MATNVQASPTHIVLIGGGHSNVQVLKILAQKATVADHVCVTLISEAPQAWYSGMIPGCVAGTYQDKDACIDLVQLADWSGARFIQARCTGLDTATRLVYTDDSNHASIHYDYVSVDIGSCTRGLEIPGVADYAICTRPISALSDKVQATCDRILAAEAKHVGPVEVLKLVVVGSGAAGLELAFCVQHKFKQELPHVRVQTTLIDRHTDVLQRVGPRPAEKLLEAAKERDIKLRLGHAVTGVDKSTMQLDDSTAEPYDVCLWATGAAAHPEHKNFTGLLLNQDRYIRVRATLQAVGDDRVFASGDCCHLDDYPHVTKAGVYAVREGPYVASNLLHLVRREALEHYEPQQGFMTLYNLGNRDAVMSYKGFGKRGSWVWWLKDRIDRAFIAAFDVAKLGARTSKLCKVPFDIPPPAHGQVPAHAGLAQWPA